MKGCEKSETAATLQLDSADRNISSFPFSNNGKLTLTAAEVPMKAKKRKREKKGEKRIVVP